MSPLTQQHGLIQPSRTLNNKTIKRYFYTILIIIHKYNVDNMLYTAIILNNVSLISQIGFRTRDNVNSPEGWVISGGIHSLNSNFWESQIFFQ